MNTVMQLASHSHSTRSILKLSLSGHGAFLCDWPNSSLLTLFLSTLWWAVPSQCCGGPIKFTSGGEKADFLTISALSFKEVIVLPSWPLSACVVNNAHGLVYRSAVQQRSLSPRISTNLSRKAVQHLLFAYLMV